MRAGKPQTPGGPDTDLISIFEGVAANRIGKLSDEGLEELECTACPGPGSCSGMFTREQHETACARRSASHCRQRHHCGQIRRSGWSSGSVPPRRAVELAKMENPPTAKDFATPTAFQNALVLDMAMGGSSNTVLHTLAIANEAGTKLDLRKLDEISARTPNICKLAPSVQYHIVEDCGRVGGIMAILKEISKIPGLLDGSAPDGLRQDAGGGVLDGA